MMAHRRSVCRHAAALLIGFVTAVPTGTGAAEWACFSPKPGHPTAEERAQFVREVSELAVRAEKRHGVPAAALAAIAIVESSYGWTRLALEANNLFAWRFGASARRDGRKRYTPECARRSGRSVQYVAFESRAEAFDYVAAKLATLDGYREYTDLYKTARKRGEAVAPAVEAWLSGIASYYSRRPEVFKSRIVRVMNDALEPAHTVSAEHNLHRLSAKLRQ